jgi:type I restriction enzyme S subunit
MRLRHVAKVNPPVDGLGRADAGTDVSFIPLEGVWADNRFDPSRIVQFDGETASYNPVAEGDLLVPKVSPTFAHGRTCVASGLANGRALATSEVFVVRPNNPDATAFLKYRLLARDFLSEGRASWTGVAGLKRISADFLRDVRLDPEAWVRRVDIANFLDVECPRIAELTAELERMDRSLKASESDIVAAMLNGFVEVPLRFRLARIDQGWSPECEARLAEAEEWGVLKAGCVNHGQFRPLEHKRLPNELIPRLSAEVRVGDVLMSRANTRDLVGSVARVDDLDGRRLLMSDKHYRLHLTSNLDPKFAASVLNSRRVRDQIETATAGASSSMQNISLDVVRRLRIPDVPVDEQTRIVGRMESLRAKTDAATAEAQALTEALAEYRDALITEAVTGTLDVTKLGASRMAESLAAVCEGERPEVLSL